MLDAIHSITWSSLAQPSSNSADAVPSALRALAQAGTKEAAERAYDRLLGALGNNHAGTYYPVVLAAVPFLGEILAKAPEPARVGALEVLVDLMASFESEPGYETWCQPDGSETSLRIMLRAAVVRIQPLFAAMALPGAGSSELRSLAAQLEQILGEDAAEPA